LSVVVAVRDTDRIWIAADSQVTRGWTKGLITSVHSFKIFPTKGNLTMGVVGTLRDANLLATSDTVFISEAAILKNEITFKEIVRGTVPAIFKELREHRRTYIKDNVEYLDSMVIIAYKDKCFMISQDGCVEELDDMFAMGSGGDVAESAYTVLRDVELTGKEKAIKSIMSSCERDLFVGFPIIITDTLTNQYELFSGEAFYSVDLKTGELTLLASDEEDTCEKETCDCDTHKETEAIKEDNKEGVSEDEGDLLTEDEQEQLNIIKTLIDKLDKL